MRHLALLVCFAASPLLAEEQLPELQPLPEPPPIPERVHSGETLKPEVTIIKRKDATVEEYRANGLLYAIKVIPTKGKPYFLVDTDGDGELETRRSDLESNLLIPSWVLIRW